MAWTLIVALACVSAGCATKKPLAKIVAPPLVVAPIVIPPRTARAQLFDAIEMLNNGDVISGRKELLAVLKRDPRESIARDLLKQIDTDPRKLLGETSYPYLIKPGESLAKIAARQLGRSTRFWALARYNNITVPVNAVAGQVIQVPGKVRLPSPARAKSSLTTASVAAPSVAPTPPRAVPAIQAKPAPTRTYPAAANRLRKAGLAELARGSIDQAVGLLARALTLNPANPAIVADLARARRIQDVVRRP